jgi:hypothetical protein
MKILSLMSLGAIALLLSASSFAVADPFRDVAAGTFVTVLGENGGELAVGTLVSRNDDVWIVDRRASPFRTRIAAAKIAAVVCADGKPK